MKTTDTQCFVIEWKYKQHRYGRWEPVTGFIGRDWIYNETGRLNWDAIMVYNSYAAAYGMCGKFEFEYPNKKYRVSKFKLVRVPLFNADGMTE